MTTQNQSSQAQSGSSFADRASGLKSRAGGLFQGGMDKVRSNPGAAAAVLGGVAAAAAAYVNRDKLSETASSLRNRSGKSSAKSDANA